MEDIAEEVEGDKNEDEDEDAGEEEDGADEVQPAGECSRELLHCKCTCTCHYSSDSRISVPKLCRSIPW